MQGLHDLLPLPFASRDHQEDTIMMLGGDINVFIGDCRDDDSLPLGD